MVPMNKLNPPVDVSLPAWRWGVHRRRWHGFAALAAVALALGACGGPAEGAQGYISGFYGGIVADEPRAALVGRDVLSSGGTAADAAVATYFTMAVTYPGAASLGGGGLCLIHDFDEGRTEALVFLATAPAQITPDADRPTAVPGNVRGMVALHARYGRQSWADLLRPAELLAREGNIVSRAFATELMPAAGPLFADPAARMIFALADGSPVVEGQLVRQVELAAVLSVLRGRGAGEFYAGGLARTLVAATAAAGGTLTLADLRAYKARYVEPIAVEFGRDTLYFTPAAGGGVAAQLWSIIEQDRRLRRAPAEEAPHLFAEASLRVLAGRGRWAEMAAGAPIAANKLIAQDQLMELMRGYDPMQHGPAPDVFPQASQSGAAGFVVADSFGQAVACNFTLNYPFGTGRMASGTGILLAASPGMSDRGATDLGAMMLVNQRSANVFYGAVASGGSAAPTSMVRVALETLLGGARLSTAIASPRLHHPGLPDVVRIEAALDEARQMSLAARGHKLQAIDRLGRVVAFYCPEGLPHEDRCEFAADPRGFGLAAVGAE